MNVVYAPRALRDLEGIAAYLVERSPSGATNVLAAIKIDDRYLELLSADRPSRRQRGHRRVPVPRYPYVIFYRLAEDELLILHIRHAARRPIDPARDL
jgi:toxin ParE1/3/4